MTTETPTRQEFEEALREDEMQQPRPQPIGAEVYEKVEAKMVRLTNTSAEDCRITLENSARTHPVETLGDVTQVLLMMNHKGIEKKSHRQAMLRAGRKALNAIGEINHGA